MKYTTAIAVLAAAGAYADLQTVQSVLSSVSNGIEELNTAAQSFHGDVDAVKSKADNLVAAIRKGRSTVDASSDLSLADALGLTDPVGDLTKKGETLLATFKAKRSDVERAAACDTVRSELRDIKDNSQALINSVVSKVPKDAQVIAQNLASGLTKVLSQAQDDFSEANCKNAGGATRSGPSSQTSPAPGNTAGASEPAAPSAGPSTSETGPAATLIPPVTVSPTHAANATATAGVPPVTAGASFLAPAGGLVLVLVAALL
ncbi:hypothetical protein E4U42_001824 [Claviceps africana]|uniref:Cell wall protein n=1 Tax=Claviceps africana TaxID=83212 RepID=A0A8K0NE00_9HYPO|nr:hypothetical protein E4U42_001824 [Claviceps africana]